MYKRQIENKIKISILIFIFLLVIYSCGKSSSERKYPFTSEEQIKEGKILTNYINDSILIQTIYNSGKIKSIVTYKKMVGKEEWVYDGDYTYYYPSGKINYKGRYSKGLREGEWYYYTDSGLLSKFEEYVIDSAIFLGENVNQFVNYYNGDIDTKKKNRYFDLINLQDTIYNLEPFVFKIQLYEPMCRQGMYIQIGDYDEYYRVKKGGIIDTIRCNSFNKTISYNRYKKGRNEIRGIIINYDSIPNNYKITPYYFKTTFCVK